MYPFIDPKSVEQGHNKIKCTKYLTFALIKYKICGLSKSFGVVAQLVEHLLCKQGVVSSSLISSTKTLDKNTNIRQKGVNYIW